MLWFERFFLLHKTNKLFKNRLDYLKNAQNVTKLTTFLSLHLVTCMSHDSFKTK